MRVRPDGWRGLTDSVANFGFSSSVYWLRASLTSGAEQPITRVLEVGHPLLDDIELYLFGADGRTLAHLTAGDHLPFEARSIVHRTFLFPLRLPPGETVELLLRVQSGSSLKVPLYLWRADAFQAFNERELAGLGLYAGIMLAMALYNLFIFFALRLRAYFYYTLFVVASGLLMLQVSGLTYQFLWPRGAWLQEHAAAILCGVAIAAGSLFSRALLRLRVHGPRLNSILGAMAGAGLLCAVLGALLPCSRAMAIILPLTMVWIVIVVSAGLVALRRGEIAARYYLIAWGVLLTVAFLNILYPLGLVPHAWAGEYRLLGASALETMLLSFALADRIRHLRGQNRTAQKRALEHLTRYQTLYQEAPYGIYTGALDGEMLAANPAALRIFGYDSLEAFRRDGRGIREHYSEPVERDLLLAELAARGHCTGFETRFRRRDGDEVWVSLSCRLTRDDSGRHLIEGSIVDISERRRRELAERARQVVEQQIEAAAESARAKAEFLSSVSDQIRAPLTALIGYGQFLLEPKVPDAQRQELARTILRSGHHLLGVVNDVLDFSRLDAGQLKIERSPVDLLELLHEIEAAFADRVRRKGLTLRLAPRFPLPRLIDSDPTRLRQILYNLCGNAVKFTEVGGVTIEVRCDAGRGRLTIAVVDTGIGISPERQTAIFEPFVQVKSGSQDDGGSGLGLNISYRLAGMLGGEIRCQSKPGEGSRFELEIDIGKTEPGLVRRAVGATDEPASRRRLPLLEAGPEARELPPRMESTKAGLELPTGPHAIMRAAARADWEATDRLASELQRVALGQEREELAALAGELSQAARRRSPERVLRLLEAVREQIDGAEV